MRSPSFIAARLALGMALAPAFVLLAAGCSSTRIEVHDRGTGVPMVQARAVAIDHGREDDLGSADAEGRLRISLPGDADAVVAVRAQGFLQWSKTAAWIRTQPQPLRIELEPVWMADFLRTGLKPSQIIDPKGCNCHPKAR